MYVLSKNIKKIQSFPMKFSNFFLKKKKFLYIAWACFRNVLFAFQGDSLTTSSLQNQNNQQFSTPDSDNDNKPNGNCAVQFHGPWWHNYCHRANLNGRYFEAPGTSGVNADGIIWVTWRGYGTSLKGSTMMIK